MKHWTRNKFITTIYFLSHNNCKILFSDNSSKILHLLNYSLAEESSPCVISTVVLYAITLQQTHLCGNKQESMLNWKCVAAVTDNTTNSLEVLRLTYGIEFAVAPGTNFLSLFDTGISSPRGNKRFVHKLSRCVVWKFILPC